jgi:FkbM family methyltransferase
VTGRCEKAYCIEPLPVFVEAMRMTFNGRSDVEVVDCAVGKSEGYTFLEESGATSHIHCQNTGTKVQIRTLDSLFVGKTPPVTYIKADVEGFEMEALMGGVELIKANKPKLAIAVYHRVDDADNIRNLLKRIGPKYKVRVKGIHSEKGQPVLLHAWI